MASNKKQHGAGTNRFRAFLKGPAGLPTLAGAGAVLIILIAALIFWAVRAHAAAPASASGSSSAWSEPADDLTYTAMEKVDKEQFSGTILPLTEDAGQEYIDETLFLGDSNTVRYMMYSATDNSKVPFTSLENNIGVTSMGVTSITSLKCEEFQGYSDKVTMPEAVKILQPKRVIIGFGTNNLTMDTDTFISNYKKGLKAIHDAYPYADIIVNAIPPLDKERENGSLSMKQVDRLNAAIAKMCEQEGYKYLDSSEALEDPATGWAKKDYTLGDGVHLNQNGVRAFFQYVRTHAYITEDTRPKPLKKIPKVIGVPAGLISNDPIAVRGAKVPVEFIASEGGRIEGATSQSVKKGQQTSAVTAVPDEGWEFAGWSATIGHVDGSATVMFTVPADADANGVVITANFRKVDNEPEPTPYCICGSHWCDPNDQTTWNYDCPICGRDPEKCAGLKPTPSPSPGVPTPTPSPTPSPTDSHQHSYTETITKQPTCTEKGLKTFTCSCGDSYTEEIPALGHDFQWVVTTTPGVGVAGEEQQQCSRNCGIVGEKRPIDALPVPTEPTEGSGTNGAEDLPAPDQGS